MVTSKPDNIVRQGEICVNEFLRGKTMKSSLSPTCRFDRVLNSLRRKKVARNGLLVLTLVNFLVLLTSLHAAPIALNSPAPRFDAWRVIGPGGGGAQFYPTISPHDPKIVLIRCDMTGAYITRDGGESWRMFNLRGTVRFFAFDLVNPRIIYAATDGLYQSTDSGRLWRLVFPQPATVVRVSMLDDHASESIVTTDGITRQPIALGVDPANSQMLYLAVSENKEPFLYLSKDGGKSWQKSVGLPGGARIICIDPRSPKTDRTIYVIGDNAVSVRQHGIWTRHPSPEGTDVFTDASAGFSPSGDLVVYVLTRAGLYVSVDGGKSWRRCNLAVLSSGSSSPRLSSVACSFSSPEVAYLSYSNPTSLTKARFFGVAKTVNTGESWELVWKEGEQSAPNIHDVWLSERFGPGWAGNPISVGVAPTNPNICYGTDSGRTMRTTDGGRNWYGVYSKKLPDGSYSTTGIDVTTCYGVHFDPFDKNRIFISYTDIGLFASGNGGAGWKSATIGVPRPWVNTTYWIEFDPQVKGRVWGVMTGIHDLPRPKMWRRGGTARYNGGVCISDDSGRTWRVASDSLPPTAATHILLDPASSPQARTLYITGFGRGVFKSTDGGKTWALKNRGIEGKEPLAWRLARDPQGVLYLVVARRSEDGSYGNADDGALYQSFDGAETWTRLPLPQGVNGPNGIAIDPQDPMRLYLAVWRRAIPDEDGGGGIYLSTDSGKSWHRVLSKDQHVYDVTIDLRNPRILYASGFESSAWRSTDRGETWTRIKGYNFKWGHRVIPDPYNSKMIYITTFGGSVWYGPAEGDPRALEDIVTPQLAPGR